MTKKNHIYPAIPRATATRTSEADIAFGSVPDIAVVRALVMRCNKSAQVLVSRRPPDASYEPGKWEFPGGAYTPGESSVRALQHIIRKKLGIGDLNCYGAAQYINRPFVDDDKLRYTGEVVTCSMPNNDTIAQLKVMPLDDVLCGLSAFGEDTPALLSSVSKMRGPFGLVVRGALIRTGVVLPVGA